MLATTEVEEDDIPGECALLESGKLDPAGEGHHGRTGADDDDDDDTLARTTTGPGCKGKESFGGGDSLSTNDTSQEEIDSFLLEGGEGGGGGGGRSTCASCDNHGEGGGYGRGDVKQHGFGTQASQQRRRKEALQWQKQRRDEILDKIRQLEDSAFSDSETEDEVDFVQVAQEADESKSELVLGQIHEETEAMDAASSYSNYGRSKRKSRSKNKRTRHFRQAPFKVMLSEWMLEKPEDFEDMWLGVVCPVGKRCIVVASRGKTKIFSRKDGYLGSYRSLLPGGCRYNYRDNSTNRNRGVTILDCIWSQESQTFYVLDLLCWNSHSCVNCDTEYRQFFIHSKFSENEELLKSSASNPFPFKPLPFFSANELPLVMMTTVIRFPELIDGILFFHKEAFYITETNPLCLWVLLTQVEAILDTPVAPELVARQVKAKNLGSRKRQIQKRSQGMEVN